MKKNFLDPQPLALVSTLGLLFDMLYYRQTGGSREPQRPQQPKFQVQHSSDVMPQLGVTSYTVHISRGKEIRAVAAAVAVVAAAAAAGLPD